MASRVGTAEFHTAAGSLCFTSSITGGAPSAPVPTTRRRQSQGMFSSIDNGVWPKASRKGFDRFLLRSGTRPPAITTSMPVDHAVDAEIEPKAN